MSNHTEKPAHLEGTCTDYWIAIHNAICDLCMALLILGHVFIVIAFAVRAIYYILTPPSPKRAHTQHPSNVSTTHHQSVMAKVPYLTSPRSHHRRMLNQRCLHHHYATVGSRNVRRGSGDGATTITVSGLRLIKGQRLSPYTNSFVNTLAERGGLSRGSSQLRGAEAGDGVARGML